MYAAIRRYNTTPGSNPEIARLATEGYLPIISKVPGFVAYYGLEAANDEYVAVAIFEDRAGAEESTKAAADFIRENWHRFCRPHLISQRVRSLCTRQVESRLMPRQRRRKSHRRSKKGIR